MIYVFYLLRKKMKTDIAYIVSHGFAARMVTQTNLLGKLVKNGYKVALILPDMADKNLSQYCKESGVKIYQFDPISDFWTKSHIELRMYFLENIKKNPALYEKYIYAKSFKKHDSSLSWLKPRLYKIVHDLKEVIPYIKKMYARRESRFLNSKYALELIQKIDPKVIVSTYPVNFQEAMLLAAAKHTQKKSIIQLLSWDNITCKGRFPHLADEYMVWGPIMKNELTEYYQIPTENIYECGVPHFDIHVKTRQNPNPTPYLKELGLTPNYPYLFFGMSSPRFAPQEIDIVEWLAKKVNTNSFGKELQLVIRPHPQNVKGNMADPTWLVRLKALISNRVAVDLPTLNKSKMAWSMQKNDMIRLSHLLAGSKVCLNSGSTLCIDSLMCGVPVILTSFDGLMQLEYWKSARRLIDYKHLKKFVNLYTLSIGPVLVKSFAQLNGELIRLNRSNEQNIGFNKIPLNSFIKNPSGTATDSAVKFLSNYLIKI